MKIIKLKAENVKRLTAVEITPDGNTITIGGNNEAGKSSVLDAIAMALGGAKLAPTEPIRKGQNEALIEVDLGDYVVTRRFKRVFKEVGSDQPDVPTNEFTSSLTVTSKPKGDEPAAKFASPQAMLDKLLGSLSFDPLTFANASGTDQQTILKRVVKLDTSDLDQAIKDLEAKQTESSRELKSAIALEASATRYDDAPASRISAADVAGELEVANQLKDTATEKTRLVELAERAAANIQRAIDIDERKIEDARAAIADLERRIAEKTAFIDQMSDIVAGNRVSLSQQEEIVTTARAVAKDALEQVPDIKTIKTRIKQVEDLNRKYETNRAADEAHTRAADARRVHESIKANLDATRRAREARIQAAAFPVEGLAFGDNGLLYKGVPFAQASQAVKLRVSVAVGVALNPSLKVLLIREGAFLDEKNLALVAQLAEEAGAQVWIERVGTQGVSVVIEDGRVAN